MGFAKDTKLQIIKSSLKNDCCGLAFFSGLLLACGEYDLKSGQVSIITDIYKLFNFCNIILLQLYGEKATLNTEPSVNLIKKTLYRITLPQKKLFEMLKDFGFLNEEGILKISNIDQHLIKEKCCKKSFIKGFFIGSATSGINLKKDPETSSTGYDIEFISYSQKTLLQFSNLLNEFNISPKIAKRKNHYVLYLKDAASVCDLLALMEAFDSVLKLQSELTIRELKNKINRQINCINANINKTVNASLRQLEAIDLISGMLGLESLPFDLQEVCLLRLANTEESLSDLVKLSESKFSKSSLYNKLNKVIRLAQKLKE